MTNRAQTIVFRPVESYRRRQGYKLVAGLDEVGRGSWAGPLVAAAVILKPYAKLPHLKDSKQVTPLRRRTWAVRIAASALGYSFGIVSAREIDEIGIAAANALAFRRAVAELKPRPDHVLADYFTITGAHCHIEGVLDGDRKVRVIAAASILAKVLRDHMLILAEHHYSGYGFAAHKGYGAAAHRRAIKKLGRSSYHRHSFAIA